MRTRVGLGFDSHPLVKGRALLLGGIAIDYPLGLQGHSDGDVLAHALTDALLGAAALGDIGSLFPPDDAAYAGADSIDLLRQAYAKVEGLSLRLGNADATIYADAPRLGPYRESMCESLGSALHVNLERVNVKFKTLEGLASLGGAEEGALIAAHVIVALESIE